MSPFKDVCLCVLLLVLLSAVVLAERLDRIVRRTMRSSWGHPQRRKCSDLYPEDFYSDSPAKAPSVDAFPEDYSSESPTMVTTDVPSVEPLSILTLPPTPPPSSLPSRLPTPRPTQQPERYSSGGSRSSRSHSRKSSKSSKSQSSRGSKSSKSKGTRHQSNPSEGDSSTSHGQTSSPSRADSEHASYTPAILPSIAPTGHDSFVPNINNADERNNGTRKEINDGRGCSEKVNEPGSPSQQSNNSDDGSRRNNRGNDHPGTVDDELHQQSASGVALDASPPSSSGASSPDPFTFLFVASLLLLVASLV
jgi:hypothetical protein